MRACQEEMHFFPILENPSLSITKVSAIKNEHMLSFETFCEPTYVRDHTECKETFKIIETEVK